MTQFEWVDLADFNFQWGRVPAIGETPAGNYGGNEVLVIRGPSMSTCWPRRTGWRVPKNLRGDRCLVCGNIAQIAGGVALARFYADPAIR